MEQSNKFQLFKEIIARSNAETWDEAKLEWVLDRICHEEEPDTCLCGHFPINEICILRNRLNGNIVTVGNVCVKKFIGLPSDIIFQAIRRITKDITNAVNAETIYHAYKNGWINDWEKDFYSDTMKKRSLTDSQFRKREQINRNILKNIKKGNK